MIISSEHNSYYVSKLLNFSLKQRSFDKYKPKNNDKHSICDSKARGSPLKGKSDQILFSQTSEKAQLKFS